MITNSLNYYIRDINKVPVISVTLLLLENYKITRGICVYRKEPGWNVNKQWGRHASYRRAQQAANAQKNIGIFKSNGNPVNFMSKIMKSVTKKNKDESNLSSIDYMLLEGLGVVVWNNKDDNNKYYLYRGIWLPSLTEREENIITKRWKRNIGDAEEFFDIYYNVNSFK